MGICFQHFHTELHNRDNNIKLNLDSIYVFYLGEGGGWNNGNPRVLSSTENLNKQLSIHGVGKAPPDNHQASRAENPHQELTHS